MRMLRQLVVRIDCWKWAANTRFNGAVGACMRLNGLMAGRTLRRFVSFRWWRVWRRVSYENRDSSWSKPWLNFIGRGESHANACEIAGRCSTRTHFFGIFSKSFFVVGASSNVLNTSVTVTRFLSLHHRMGQDSGLGHSVEGLLIHRIAPVVPVASRSHPCSQLCTSDVTAGRPAGGSYFAPCQRTYADCPRP